LSTAPHEKARCQLGLFEGFAEETRPWRVQIDISPCPTRQERKTFKQTVSEAFEFTGYNVRFSEISFKVPCEFRPEAATPAAPRLGGAPLTPEHLPLVLCGAFIKANFL